jgi:hypothetical protein
MRHVKPDAGGRMRLISRSAPSFRSVRGGDYPPPRERRLTEEIVDTVIAYPLSEQELRRKRVRLP